MFPFGSFYYLSTHLWDLIVLGFESHEVGFGSRITLIEFSLLSFQDVGGSAQRKELAAGNEPLGIAVQVSHYREDERLRAGHYRWSEM